MIGRTEIDVRGEELGVSVTDVQRDFVYDWLLVGIYTTSPLGTILSLKGGNAFRKAYFPDGRFSHDLDFSTDKSLAPEFLETELQAVCRFASERSGITFVLGRTRVKVKQQIDTDRVVYEARVYFTDFYNDPGTITIRVKLDVIQFDRIYLPIQTRRLIHKFSDADVCQAEIRVLKLEELLAAKLVCLLQRRHSLDLFDLVYAIFGNKIIDVDRAEILRTFLQKTIFGGRSGAAKALLLGLPLQLFAGVWERYLICPKESFVGLDQAVQWYGTVIDEIFGPGRSFSRDDTFFPSEIRSKIMDAAEKQVLLKVRYKGSLRLMEPYSLSYKVRKDGVGREYFYVWNRSGGSSGVPGMRSLVASQVQSLELTEEGFEAQFPIDLSKSIERGTEGYFHRPFRTGSGERTPSVRRVRRRGVRGVVFVVQCFICSRKFERTTRGTTLRPHKDGYGNRCYGKRGSVVDQRYE